MDVLERARKLKEEADFILREVRLREIFNPVGEIIPSGSYSLDLMAYPDIDVYVPPVTIEQIFQAGAQLAGCPLVHQVVFEKSNEPNLPGGLYLKPRIWYGSWGRPWKIDIWSVAPDIIQLPLEEMCHFKNCLTPQLRKQILAYKCSVLTADHRTPMHSGYFIYKAMIDEGIENFDDVTRYLVAHGIQVGEL